MDTIKIKEQLKSFYDKHALDRSKAITEDWKKELRLQFLHIMQQNNSKTLLDIGAGTGVDSIYFKDQNLDVTAIDLSSKHVDILREHNIKAHVMDFYKLEFLNQFDAIYSMNSLLHVPKNDLNHVLIGIKSILKRDGYLFICVYGGVSDEGIKNYKNFEGERFFSSYSFMEYKNIVEKYFQIEYSKRIEFQSYESHCFILQNNK